MGPERPVKTQAGAGRAEPQLPLSLLNAVRQHIQAAAK